MTDELDLLKKLTFVEPSEQSKAILNSHGSRRILSLQNFKSEPGCCCWCGSSFESKGLKHHHMRRWCSSDCIASAQHLCNPQDPSPKMHRLIYDQNFACKICGESFEEEIRKLIKKRYENHNNVWHYQPGGHEPRFRPEPKPIHLHTLGYGTGDRWQTDHVIPVHKGGKGIDPENLQVVCVPCHKAKTKTDNQK